MMRKLLSVAGLLLSGNAIAVAGEGATRDTIAAAGATPVVASISDVTLASVNSNLTSVNTALNTALNTTLASVSGAATVGLRVLSYNIQALPSPLKKGTAPLFARIAEMLQERRAKGTQPHVVLLQEAFDKKTDVILEQAGYRYILKGPGKKTKAKLGQAHWVQKTRKSYVKFTDPQKFMGSGLVILSDYPIIKGHHKSFNSDECAGIDCMANKSMQMARIDVPGLAQPVDIVNSHFNSRRSAKAPRKLSLKIHHKQTDKLKWFLKKTGVGNPVIVAGDFNTKQGARYEYFAKKIALTDAGTQCVSDNAGCIIAKGTKVEMVLFDTNDKHFYEASDTVSIAPYFIERNFAETLDGKELSDHLGYEIHYKLSSQPVAND
ncbi:MAG: endonuclease/exonuclease/phosphatase family protein [Kordiimonadaceae bacterium]|nr:endonuclease/exonuclease/phosphatase family protein [Kordiimonadaceae bacterium]